LFPKFVKFHLVQGGNRQEITRENNVVKGGKISLNRARKSQPHAGADVFQLCHPTEHFSKLMYVREILFHRPYEACENNTDIEKLFS